MENEFLVRLDRNNLSVVVRILNWSDLIIWKIFENFVFILICRDKNWKNNRYFFVVKFVSLV